MTREIDRAQQVRTRSPVAVLDVHGRSADPVEGTDKDRAGGDIEVERARSTISGATDGDGIGVEDVGAAAQLDALDGIARRIVGGDRGRDDGGVCRQDQGRTIGARTAAGGIGGVSDAQRTAAKVSVEGAEAAQVEGRGVADTRGTAVAYHESLVGRRADVTDLESAGAGDGQPGRGIGGRVIANRERPVDLEGLARADRDRVRGDVVGLDQHRAAETRAGRAEVQRESGGAAGESAEIERVGDAGESLVARDDQRAFIQSGHSTVGVKGGQSQRAGTVLLDVESVQAVIDHAVHGQIAGRHGDQGRRPQGHGAGTHDEVVGAEEIEGAVPDLGDVPAERQRATGSVIEDTAVKGERPAAEGVGMTDVQSGAGSHGDAPRSTRIISIQRQVAVGQGGESAVGIGAVQDQDARSRLGQAEGSGAIADGSADGQGLGGDSSDDIIPKRHGPSAEVQRAGAGEGEISVPILGVVAGIDDGGRTRVDGRARTDAERTGTESAVVTDDKGAGGEVDAA